MMLPELERSEEALRMFLNEARLAATLHHPNIAQVYDIGTIDGSYFFAMEYVHGRNLAEIAARLQAQGKAFPPDVAVSVLLGVCAGLHYAHSKRGEDSTPLRIIHRDV